MTPPTLACCLLLACPLAAAPGVAFEGAWIRGPVPGQTVAAGYCEIVNKGAAAVTLTGFDGSVRVELHETKLEQGMARMRRLDDLTIAPSETLSLRPGGKHLMLFDVDANAKEVTLHAVFASGERQEVVFPVRRFDGQ